MAETTADDVWVDSWFTIWYRPRATMRRIVDTDPHKFVIAIAFVAGALAALESQAMLASVALPPEMPHMPRLGPLAVALAAILLGLLSVVSLYGLGVLYRWSGHILGGTAERVEVRAALAWAQVPGIYFAVVMILAAVLGIYTPPIPHTTSPVGVVETIVGIWVFVISLKCLGEVHRFSAWRALGAILLGTLATLAVAVGAVFAIWLAVVVARSML